MAYRVEITLRAQQDLDEIYEWVTTQASFRGPRWFDRFEESILSLRAFPQRCPVVDSLSTDEDTVRHLVFGRSRHRYLVYFSIFDDVVRVLHVRHGSRDFPSREDLFD